MPVHVQAVDGFLHIELGTAGLSQELTVTPGTRYYVCGRAEYAANPTSSMTPSSETLGIYIDGNRITSATAPYGGGWQTTPLGNFTPTSNKVTLNIKGDPSSPFVDLIYVGTAGYCPTWVLPVNLIAFTAEPLGNKDALLHWTTASETNNSHFDIERSYDGKTFETVGEVAGNGNSQHQIEYSYTDASVSKVENTVYYRLKQVDFDGAYEYSDIRVVRFDAVGNDMQLAAFPNPLNDELNVMLSLPSGEKYQLQVTNLQGALVHQRNHVFSSGLHTLDLSQWNSGMYIVEVISDRGSEHIKVMKK